MKMNLFMPRTVRLSREELQSITSRARPKSQAAWFEEYLGIAVPSDERGPILTMASYEALLAQRLGIQSSGTPAREVVINIKSRR